MKRSVWIDIENPPQVQYLAPFVSAFGQRGYPVVVTARDTAITVDLLRSRGIAHTAVGGHPPADRLRKVAAVARRAAGLRHLMRAESPVALVCSSRAAAVAAWSRRIPSFVVCDYEFAELGLYRRFGSTLLHPAIVPARSFEALGFPKDRLVAFRGIKEDISFAGIDIDAVPTYDLGARVDGIIRILLRPPAEASHYFDPRSRALVLAVLDELAGRDDVQMVFSPRHPHQVRDVETRHWRRKPVILKAGVSFVSLLKAVDRVVSAGGTMLREAAYLGMPAFSLFAGHMGAVDDELRRAGRLTVISSDAELDALTATATPLSPFPRNDAILDELADLVLVRAA